MTRPPEDQGERAAAREARLEAAQQMLEAAVGALVTGDDWRRALAFSARFRTRSFNNTLLIYVQHLQAYQQGRVPDPTPTYVAGYRQWLALGRHVLQGQSGYVILAPVTARYAREDPEGGPWRRLAPSETPGSGEAVRSAVVGVKRAHVWDVSQTEGDPVPEPPVPQLLRGTAPGGLWDGLATQIVHLGFRLRRVPDATAIYGANGLTDYAAKVVSVRQDMDDAAQVKTLAHELGHVLLHGPDNPDAVLHRGIAEVEAESVALMIGAAHGLDTSTYTVPYVASWASSVPDKSPIEVVKSTAERVRTTAVSILDKLATAQVGNGEPPGLETVRQAAAVARRGRSRQHRAARSTVVTR